MTQWIEVPFFGTQGVAITTGNTPSLARVSGTAATFDSATAKTGVAARVQTAAALSLLEFDHTSVSDAWYVFYLNIVSLPAANTSFVAVWNGTTAAACDLRLKSDGTIQLRNGTFTLQATSTALSLGLHRMALRVQAASVGAGGLRLEIYSGANVDGTTPSQTITGSSASGPETISNFRFGCTASGTIDVAFDEIHIGDTQWLPAGTGHGTASGSTIHIGSAAGSSPSLPTSVAHYDLTANYPMDSSLISSWVLDSATSVGTTSLVQTSGTTATITPNTPSSGQYTITNPSGTDDLVFTFSANSNGTPAQKVITLVRGSGGTTERPAVYVKTDSGWF